jgi:hypothetical protein
MATDLFDQLADLEVPPPPVEFDRNLHERLNRSLTTQQIFDLGLRALPCAGIELLRALAGFISLTITGAFPSVTKERPNNER